MHKPLLELKDVSITRGTKQVLNRINWCLNEGEHWVLLGPNGSGKTTLLEIASGYLWPTDGEVYLLGNKLGEVYLPDLRKKVGFVSSWVMNRIQGDVTVDDVIASGVDASIGYVGVISNHLKAQIHHELEFFDALELCGRVFGDLSSGEKLKVILSRALINHPKLLILDEPFVHLDMTTRQHCYELLAKLSRKPNGPGIILVTHYQEDICPFFTHALMLNKGRIHSTGIKDEILKGAGHASIH